MSIPTVARRWNDLQTLYELGVIGTRCDGQLLEHFRTHSGPSADAAFRALVERHGPMVLRVCRAVLADEHDAQDAFQATFLVLIRKSKSVRNQASVGSWLHGVARRVASKARVEASRRHAHEQRVAGLKGSRDASAKGADSEFNADCILKALDEEIGRLPEKYRAPVVLCYLEGLTQERAAEHLGWPSGTVRGRLARARELLKSRLSRRGLVTPASVLATSGILGAQTASAAACPVPKGLILATVQASSLGVATNSGSVISTLAANVVRSMMVVKLKVVSVVAVGLGIITVGAGMGALGALPATTEIVPPKPPISKNPPTAVNAPSIPVIPNTESKPQEREPEPQPKRFPSARAFPIQIPTIDGDLSDWPKESLVWHDIETVFPKEAKVTGFGARFATAYNLEDQRIYVAVEVNDDRLVTGHKSWHTDAVEIFVEAIEAMDRSKHPRDFRFGSGAAKWPMLQYSGVPAKGKAYTDAYGLNPTLNDGDCRKTRTAMKYRTAGNVTTYEWAVEVFDRYPDRPALLEPGKHIGFDLAVVDQDTPPNNLGQENTATPWICWGRYPESGFKGFDLGNIGELILMNAP